MEIELKLGSEFVVGKTKLVVAKGVGCDGCFFSGKLECGGLACQAGCRQDGTSVVFVEVKENTGRRTEELTSVKRNRLASTKSFVEFVQYFCEFIITTGCVALGILGILGMGLIESVCYVIAALIGYIVCKYILKRIDKEEVWKER